MGENICCFSGHRDTPERIRTAIALSIENHILRYGVTDFLVGHYGNFDQMSKSAVSAAKKKYPEVKLHLMLAYLPEGHKPDDWRDFDDLLFPEGQETVPARAAIPRLNREMIDRSGFLIAYVRHVSGGSYQSLHYAREREKRGFLRITNLAEKGDGGLSRL